jgi:two-component system, OmpR family, sensor histidine kinase MtrB
MTPVPPRRRGLRGVWSRSLALRVATTTVLIAGSVVFVVGVFMNNRIADGILSAKKDGAQAQAQTGIAAVTARLQAFEPGDILGVSNVLNQLDVSSGLASVGSFVTSVQGADEVIQQSLGKQPDVPAALQQTVAAGTLAMQYAPIAGHGGGTVPGLIVGGQVSSRVASFQLYYLFPLVTERDSIALVQRTALLAGLGLVLLIATIALLVTRQVVRPVRVAARTAERLAGGDLDQRIDVHGQDELALLGSSFNDMAESLQRQFTRLEQLSVSQRRFTSDVSHELRTPLTTVRMGAEVLDSRRADFSPDVARSVELLNAELDRFESLLADLLEISRYDAGVVRLEREPTDVGAIVRRVTDANRAIAEQQGVAVQVTLPEKPITADADPRRLERILRNLVANAIDHSEGKPVDVVVGGNDEAVSILVRDHGVGLKDGEEKLVFNRFWRGDPSRSRRTGGTGLGLAISLEDARLHGGWLQAAGRPGVGAAFVVTLPLRPGVELTDAPLTLPASLNGVHGDDE